MAGIKVNLVDIDAVECLLFANHVHFYLNEYEDGIEDFYKDDRNSDTWYSGLSLDDPASWEIRYYSKYFFKNNPPIYALIDPNSEYCSIAFYSEKDLEYTEVFKDFQKNRKLNKDLLNALLVEEKISN